MKIGIIGSGKFGLVLARIAAENKNEVFIYSRRANEVESINAKNESLSGFSFGELVISATQDVNELNNCDALLVTVASKDFIESISKFNYQSYQGKFVSCVKGFDKNLTGFSLDKCFFETKTVPLKPGVTGLNLFNII